MRSWAPAILLLCSIGCADPLETDRIKALGGEVPGVDPSEFHRPGQPCVLCHSPEGGATPYMAFAGTIFATPNTVVPVEGVVVTLTDALSNVKTAKPSNCIGNFFITTDDWTPAYPVRAEIVCPIPQSSSDRRSVMPVRIYRDGSCGGCHKYTGTDPKFKSIAVSPQESPGWVACGQEMPVPNYRTPGSECQGVPQ